MANEKSNNQVEAPKAPLSERLNKYYQEKNEFRKMNGGCAIKADIDATLADLSLVTKPTQENLPGLVRAAVESKDAKARKLEEIWAEKISMGATHIGIIDGVVGFYKGEEKLPENNVALKISALPLDLELRDQEKTQVRDRFKELREQFKKEFFGGAPAAVTKVEEPSQDDAEAKGGTLD